MIDILRIFHWWLNEADFVALSNALSYETESLEREYLDGLVKNCINSIANALELFQSCTKQSIWLIAIQGLFHPNTVFRGSNRFSSKRLHTFSWDLIGKMMALMLVLSDHMGFGLHSNVCTCHLTEFIMFSNVLNCLWNLLLLK